MPEIEQMQPRFTHPLLLKLNHAFPRRRTYVMRRAPRRSLIVGQKLEIFPRAKQRPAVPAFGVGRKAGTQLRRNGKSSQSSEIVRHVFLSPGTIFVACRAAVWTCYNRSPYRLPSHLCGESLKEGAVIPNGTMFHVSQVVDTLVQGNAIW